jgi:hypothetical protein
LIVKFTQRLIDIAIELKKLELPWEPAVGNYVYDVNNVVKPSSPFQEGVYFLLNYDCFTSRLGGVERFRDVLVWLPTWDDARQLLRSLGCDDAEQSRELAQSGAIDNGSELLKLYEMLLERLRTRHALHARRSLSSRDVS